MHCIVGLTRWGFGGRTLWAVTVTDFKGVVCGGFDLNGIIAALDLDRADCCRCGFHAEAGLGVGLGLWPFGLGLWSLGLGLCSLLEISQDCGRLDYCTRARTLVVADRTRTDRTVDTMRVRLTCMAGCAAADLVNDLCACLTPTGTLSYSRVVLQAQQA